MAQLTGFPSITAAAEGPVTFGCFFYRWKARLLGWWGLSCAVGKRRAAKGRPYEIRGTLRSFRRGRTLSRSVEDFLQFRGPPSSVWPSASHLPPCRGKAGAGGHMGPPLRRKTGRVRWLINARRGCGAAPGAIFHEVRPQWAGGNLDCYSDFARRK